MTPPLTFPGEQTRGTLTVPGASRSPDSPWVSPETREPRGNGSLGDTLSLLSQHSGQGRDLELLVPASASLKAFACGLCGVTTALSVLFSWSKVVIISRLSVLRGCSFCGPLARKDMVCWRLFFSVPIGIWAFTFSGI